MGEEKRFLAFKRRERFAFSQNFSDSAVHVLQQAFSKASGVLFLPAVQLALTSALIYPQKYLPRLFRLPAEYRKRLFTQLADLAVVLSQNLLISLFKKRQQPLSLMAGSRCKK